MELAQNHSQLLTDDTNILTTASQVRIYIFNFLTHNDSKFKQACSFIVVTTHAAP